MQQRLKPMAGSARTGVVSAKFFKKLFAAVYYAVSALDLGFRRVALPPLACYLKTSVG